MSFATKSPWVLHYAATSCNGCDIEVLACLTPTYDVERFGILNTGNPKHADILLVTGSVEGGKTSYLSALVDLLKDKGVNVGGFLCPGIFEQGKRSDFVLENIGDGKQVRMATSRKSEGWIPYRRFYFNPEAFRQGKEWISLCLQGKPQVVVIDEVGPMEMEDSGWWESFKQTM